MINALRPFHLLDTKNIIFIFITQNSQKLKLNKNVRNLINKKVLRSPPTSFSFYWSLLFNGQTVWVGAN